MKEIVSNRARISLARKLRLAGTVVRENGLLWTLDFSIYYLTSAASEAAFARMNRRRSEKGLPGLNSRRINEEIWQDWDWNAGGDEWTPSEPWKQSLVASVLERYVPEGTDVLEIGPGAGRWTEYLLPRCRSLVAVDIAESCIRVCRDKFAGYDNAQFLVGDGESLGGVDDDSIDVVWSFDVFVHINDTEVGKYLGECARVLRDGGMGVIHHGEVGGIQGGWRSNLTSERFNALLAGHGLEREARLREWQCGGETFEIGGYGDCISVFRKP